MIKLKQVIHYADTNSVEATWVDEVTGPDAEAPIQEVVVVCHSFADVQMGLFREYVAKYGGDIAEYEKLISEVEAAVVPPEPIPVVIPTIVSMRQARLALLYSGLLDQVAAAIANISAPTHRSAATIEWEYAQDVDRNSPFVEELSAGLNLSGAQLDALFAAAATY